MKLYSVFSLYVVKVKNNYFICHETFKENVYKEFFTKEIIIIQNEKDVESLSNYYSLLEVMDYETSEPLRLNKKQILLQYLEINKQSLDKINNEQTNKRKGIDIKIKGWDEYTSMLDERENVLDIPIKNAKELKK